MILPIIAFGDPVLRKMGEEITPEYPGLKTLVDNMFETMYKARGVGLAAPQVGLAIRLFIVDSKQISHEDDDRKPKDEKGIKEVFINPTIEEEWDVEKDFEEGCLSIPGIRGDVTRKSKLKIRYFDINFKEQIKEFDNFTARVIQHEYDHIEGKMFVDRLKPLKKQLIRNRLNDITLGKVDVDYRMKFPKRK